MKRALFAVILIALVSCSRHPGVPRKVIKAFEKRFENALNVTWDTNPTHLIAYFEEDNVTKTAHFTKNAKWLRTTTSVSHNDLSPCIADYVRENYPGMEMIEIEMIENILTKRYQIAVNNIIEDNREVENNTKTSPVEYQNPNTLEEYTFEIVTLAFGDSCNFLGKNNAEPTIL